MIWSSDSILSRQSWAELLDVLLSHTLELNEAFKLGNKKKHWSKDMMNRPAGA